MWDRRRNILEDAYLSQGIYQQSWESGEVPVGWRAADVTAVFKKGKKKSLVVAGLSVSLW